MEELNEKYKIVFSKSAESLPLTAFKVGEALPCMERFEAVSLKTANKELY